VNGDERSRVADGGDGGDDAGAAVPAEATTETTRDAAE